MKGVLNYNFRPEDIVDGDFHALYSVRRRDANFAYVFLSLEGHFIAIRDHLGIVPLFYRFHNGTYQFSTHLADLITVDDTISMEGLKLYLAFGTAKISSLFNEIGIVAPGTIVEFNPSNQQITTLYQYQISIRDVSSLRNFQDYVAECRHLMLMALQRIVHTDRIGLLLSGGIDSAIIGFLLREMGVSINAYTIGAWGKSSSELPIARNNANLIGVENHFFDLLETSDYENAIEGMPLRYQMPHGTRASLSIMMLWNRTQISQENQLIFGQNADTMTGAMSTQYITYFLSKLPKVLRQRYFMPYDDLVSNFLSYVSKGLVSEAVNMTGIKNLSSIQKLIIAGMRIAHTPSDSETFILPAMQAKVPIINPYYDMDLIEFFLAVPFKYQVKISTDLRTPFQFEKKILQGIALEWLPAHVVQRKKALTVSFDRDKYSLNLATQLPKAVEGIELKLLEQRFAALSLHKWLSHYGLNVLSHN